MTTPAPSTLRQPIPELPPGRIETPEGIALEITTLNDLAGTLPGTGQSYRFKPPTVGTRKQLGMVQANQELAKYPARLAAHYLATALLDLGGQDLSAMKPDAAALAVAALPVGDVVALSLLWKGAGHPRGVNIGESRCGACNADFAEILVKLGELEAKAAPVDAGAGGARRLEDLVASVGLFQGFPYPTGKVARTVLVRPPRWIDTWWNLGRAGWNNPELIKAGLLRASIVAVDTGPVAILPETAIDGIWPEDQELIDHALDGITPGPVTTVSVTCPACKADNEAAIDWMAVGFTGGPSRA